MASAKPRSTAKPKPRATTKQSATTKPRATTKSSTATRSTSQPAASPTKQKPDPTSSTKSTKSTKTLTTKVAPSKPHSIDEYLINVSDQATMIFNSVRTLIHEISPDVAESISYGIPSFRIKDKPYVHVAVWKTHLAMYPFHPVDDPNLELALLPYRASKATGRFPFNKPLPIDLIERFLRHLAQPSQ
jgi:uncharacterized protein YdhG (YjbR/CyaY superfamily)